MPPFSESSPSQVLSKLKSSAELKTSVVQDRPQLESNSLERFETSNFEHGYEVKIVWLNVAVGVYYHLAAIYGVYLMFTSANIHTLLWALLLYQLSFIGTTAGMHRLWAHRCYNAKWPLRLILIILSTLSFQHHVYEWVRDHRAHHKFCDTNGDPHNANRGFFFAHMGWLFCRKHPDVIQKGKRIDLSDLEQDPLVMFQKRHYFALGFLIHLMIPMVVPVYFWGENWSNAYHIAVMLRHTAVLHGTWLVNSAAHMWGDRPYDKFIKPTENLIVSVLVLGEGWHNYHHVFPWDYRASELGISYAVNVTTAFIDGCSLLNWAYDLKTVPVSLVAKRAQRTGGQEKHSHEGEVWGWDDKDMLEKDKESAVILKREQKSE